MDPPDPFGYAGGENMSLKYEFLKVKSRITDTELEELVALIQKEVDRRLSSKTARAGINN
jgi:hypothetical protein